MPRRGGTPRPSFEDRASASDAMTNAWLRNHLAPDIPPGSRLFWHEDGIHKTSASLVTDDGFTLFRYYRKMDGQWRMRLNGEWMDVADEETARNMAEVLYGPAEQE